MADDDYGQAVFSLESENLLHEGSGGFSLLGVVEEEGDVVYEDVADAAVFCSRCNTVKNGVFQIGVHDVVRTDFGPQEGIREAMDDGRDLPFNVAHLELLGREFTVQIKDCVLSGDSLGHLGGQDGFAGVGGGEEDGAFPFDQKVVEVCLGVGFLHGVIDPLVGAFDGHDADSIQHLLELLYLGRDGGNRVDFIERSHTDSS